MKQLTQCISSHKKSIAVSFICMILMCMGVVGAFAADVPAEDVSSLTSSLSEVLNPIMSMLTFANIAKFLGIAVGACTALVLGWFGVRKLISMVQKALKKGRLSI